MDENCSCYIAIYWCIIFRRVLCNLWEFEWNYLTGKYTVSECMVMFSGLTFFLTHSTSPFIEHHYIKFGFNPILYRENQASYNQGKSIRLTCSLLSIPPPKKYSFYQLVLVINFTSILFQFIDLLWLANSWSYRNAFLCVKMRIFILYHGNTPKHNSHSCGACTRFKIIVCTKLYDYSFDYTPSTQPEWKCIVGTAIMARTSPCIFRYTYIHKLNAHGELNYV